MLNRCAHALMACALYFLVAELFGWVAGKDVDEVRMLLWSIGGVALYGALSYVFGFDPYRKLRDDEVPAFLQFIDRWELRSGQATLSLLGCLILIAYWTDTQYFVTAVVSGTLAAYMYFTTRLCLGAYSKK